MLGALLARLHRWFDRHPFAGDYVVAAVALLLVAGELISDRLFSYDTPVAPTTEEVVLSLALVAPLPFGPRAPVAVFATVMATCAIQLAVTDHVLVADLAALVALYYLIVHGPSRLKRVGLGVALAGGVVMSALASFPGVLDGFGDGRDERPFPCGFRLVRHADEQFLLVDEDLREGSGCGGFLDEERSVEPSRIAQKETRRYATVESRPKNWRVHSH
jgi:hypothetical protein